MSLIILASQLFGQVGYKRVPVGGAYFVGGRVLFKVVSAAHHTNDYSVMHVENSDVSTAAHRRVIHYHFFLCSSML